MPVDRNRCPECQGKMVQGFLPDYSRHRVRHPIWVEGELRPTFWSSMDIKNRDLRAVVTWRCSDCGALRSYADELAQRPTVFD